MDPKRKAILARIKRLEEAISKAHEYLETGAHAEWSGFRPAFQAKVKDGTRVPPHRDWVRNVFLPGCERSLSRAEKLVERLDGLPSAGHRGERHGGAAVTF